MDEVDIQSAKEHIASFWKGLNNGALRSLSRNATAMVLAYVEHLENTLCSITKERDEAKDDLGRMQDKVYEIAKGVARDHGVEEWRIDGAGCDSGDPVDFTGDEMCQAIRIIEDDLDDAKEVIKKIASACPYVEEPGVGPQVALTKKLTKLARAYLNKKELPARSIPDMPLMTEEEQYKARSKLALSHEDGVCHIYADDGELQCNNIHRHGRCLDFRREPYADLVDEVTRCMVKEVAEKGEG